MKCYKAVYRLRRGVLDVNREPVISYENRYIISQNFINAMLMANKDIDHHTHELVSLALKSDSVDIEERIELR